MNIKLPRRLLVASCLVWSLLGTVCLAQEDRLSQIEKDLTDVKKDVGVIREMLTKAIQGPPPIEHEVNIGGGSLRGDSDAKVTMIEFSDFQCPFCGKFFNETFSQIDKEFIQAGKVRFVMRNFPLTAIHANAQKAAEAAECAGEQGKYWQMHDKLFQNQSALEVASLKEYAKGIGLDKKGFDECLDGGKQAIKVREDLREGQTLAITGTPTFFLGLTKPGNTIKGTYIEGAQPVDVYRQAIKRLLNQAGQLPPQQQ
jgi:protein-disulfide isomerase